jgi:hypothetical protein
MHRLHNSPIEWHEDQEELVLHLPPRVWRLARPLLGGAALFVPFLLFVAYASDGWLPAVIGMAAVPAVLLSIAYAKMRDAYLADTRVTITPDRAIVTAVRRGRQTKREFALKPRSRAWQWTPRQATSRSPEPRPEGIVIADPSYDPEAGDVAKVRSKPRFGGNLTRGELDWLEWRVNLFLVRQGHGAAPEPEEEETPPARQDGLVRIRDDGFETRIVYPNTMATGSFSGVWILVIGLVLLTIAGAPLLIIWRDGEHMDWPQLLKMLAYLGVVGILGLAGTSNGLGQLFGKRQLTISPRRVQYRASVVGISVWWTLATRDIISVWDPSKRRATHGPNTDIASAAGAVIRTARREMPLRAVQDALASGASAAWLAGEIRRHIVAARAKGISGTAVP